MDYWVRIAHEIENEYGGFVDWRERFFICPECGEPIYECDWENAELINVYGDFICPVCEEVIE